MEKLIAVAKRGSYGQRDATLILVAYRHGLRATGVVSKPSAASLMPTPPQDRAYADDRSRDKHDKQGRVFDPGNCRNAQRHDQAEKADLPREHMHARGKGAKRQQGENRQPRRLRGKNPLHAAEQHQIHHQQEGEPMQRLGYDQAQSPALVARFLPPGGDADQRDDRREKFPSSRRSVFLKSSYRRPQR